MRKRRRRLLVGLALLGLLGVLALPGVHWRLIGWAKGEPFYRGRPASYWVAELRSFELDFTSFLPGDFYWVRPVGLPPEWCWRLGLTARCQMMSATEMPLSSDPEAVPLLRALLHNPDPSVRFKAAVALAAQGNAAASAVPDLRDLSGDEAEAWSGIPIGRMVVRYLLPRIAPDAPKEPPTDPDAAGPCRSKP
jgi:hypothetical protein